MSVEKEELTEEELTEEELTEEQLEEINWQIIEEHFSKEHKGPYSLEELATWICANTLHDESFKRDLLFQLKELFKLIDKLADRVIALEKVTK